MNKFVQIQILNQQIDSNQNLHSLSFTCINVIIQFIILMSSIHPHRRKYQQLVQKRINHDKIISDLISNYSSNSKSKSILTYFDNEPILNTGRSVLSCASDIHKQVNLLSNLDKFQAKSSEAKWKMKENHLSSSIQHQLDVQDIQIYSSQMKESIFNGQLIDFDSIVAFLHDQMIWNELFLITDSGIFVKLFGQKQQPYTEINIGFQPLSQEQLGLILKEDNVAYIGYLLLHRTLNYLKTSDMGWVMRSLLGYPFHNYNIQKTTEYLKFLQMIKDKENHKIGMKAYGRDKVKKLTKIQNTQFEYLSSLVNKYEQVLLIFEEQFCFMKCEVIHNRNHHAVLDFIVEEKQYYFLSAISKAKPIAFKMAIINSKDEIVSYYQMENGQSQMLYLAQGEYKIYLRGNCNEEVSNLTFIAQSRVLLKEENLTLKFDLKYNEYTSHIIGLYLKTVDIKRLQTQLLEMIEKCPNQEIFVMRCYLKFLGFCCDFITVRPKQGVYPLSLKIGYEEAESLCDLDYHKHKKTITVNEGEVVQINLSKDAKINGDYGNWQITL